MKTGNSVGHSSLNDISAYRSPKVRLASKFLMKTAIITARLESYSEFFPWSPECHENFLNDFFQYQGFLLG